MNKKLLVMGIVILLSHNIFAFSGSVGIQVIQHDPYMDDVRASSETIEGVILDTFFDYGLVVSNSPIVPSRNDSRDDKDIKISLREALEGRMDLLIVVTVNYNDSASANPSSENLSNINTVTWKVIDVVTQKDIARKNYEVEAPTSRGNSKDGVKKYASDVAWDILAALKKM